MDSKENLVMNVSKADSCNSTEYTVEGHHSASIIFFHLLLLLVLIILSNITVDLCLQLLNGDDAGLKKFCNIENCYVYLPPYMQGCFDLELNKVSEEMVQISALYFTYDTKLILHIAKL